MKILVWVNLELPTLCHCTSERGQLKISVLSFTQSGYGTDIAVHQAYHPSSSTVGRLAACPSSGAVVFTDLHANSMRGRGVIIVICLHDTALVRIYKAQ